MPSNPTQAFARLLDAAKRGDQKAAELIDAVQQASDDTPVTGVEQGRAEAVRRFGHLTN